MSKNSAHQVHDVFREQGLLAHQAVFNIKTRIVSSKIISSPCRFCWRRSLLTDTFLYSFICIIFFNLPGTAVKILDIQSQSTPRIVTTGMLRIINTIIADLLSSLDFVIITFCTSYVHQLDLLQ